MLKFPPSSFSLYLLKNFYTKQLPSFSLPTILTYRHIPTEGFLLYLTFSHDPREVCVCEYVCVCVYRFHTLWDLILQKVTLDHSDQTERFIMRGKHRPLDLQRMKPAF